MAENVSLLGADYPDVPAVVLPRTGGGEATFFEEHEVVKDVQVNGTSVLDENRVANVPRMNGSTFGVAKAGMGYGISVNNGGFLTTDKTSSAGLKRATDYIGVLTASRQHESVFWGLSKAAGVDLGQTDAELGTYPSNSQLAIQQMLGLWTPKFVFTATCQEDVANWGVGSSYEFQLGDAELNIWEELVVLIYQTDSENYPSIMGNNWGQFVLRDQVNNTYLGHSGYIMGSSPTIIRYKRFPNVLFTEIGWCNSINTSTPLRATVRSVDYVDKLRWCYVHAENSVVKAGTRLDMYIHRFI